MNVLLLNFSGKWFRSTSLRCFNLLSAFSGIINYQGSGDISCPETIEIIQPALAPPRKFYILSSKVRACVFIFSGFRFVSASVARIRPRHRLWLHSLTFPFGVYRASFPTEIQLYLYYTSRVGCQGPTVRFYGWYTDDRRSKRYKNETGTADILAASFHISINLHNTLFYCAESSVKC